MMADTKLTSDKIFDGTRFVVEKVLVLREDGVVEGLVDRADAGEGVRVLDGIICPGFINCHCHLELSHMKGLIPSGTGLADFVLSVVRQRHFPDEEILASIEKAEDEMLANGIVAAGDICNNVLSLAQKARGRIYYHNFIEAAGYEPSISRERFEKSLSIFREYARFYSIPIMSNSIVPHAPYSVSEPLWELLLQFPGNHLLTMHNQETEAENEWFIQKTGDLGRLYEGLNINVDWFQPTGKSSLQSVLPKFLKNQVLILVHNVHSSEADILFTQKSGIANNIYWCLCPKANQYITGQLPDLELLRRLNCWIVLGTDSLASNDELSILGEIRAIRQQFPGIGWEEILQWATSNGAAALEMDPLLGSFARGKKPGVLRINPESYSVERIN